MPLVIGNTIFNQIEFATIIKSNIMENPNATDDIRNAAKKIQNHMKQLFREEAINEIRDAMLLEQFNPNTKVHSLCVAIYNLDPEFFADILWNVFVVFTEKKVKYQTMLRGFVNFRRIDMFLLSLSILHMGTQGKLDDDEFINDCVGLIEEIRADQNLTPATLKRVKTLKKDIAERLKILKAAEIERIKQCVKIWRIDER